MGKSNFKGALDLSTKVIFAYPQDDGSLLVVFEEYNELSAPKKRR